MYYHPNTAHKNFTNDLSNARLRLHEIARQLKEDDLRSEERNDLIRESKDLILKENVGMLRETIEQKIDEGKSETEIWRYCQSKIASLDETINDVIQKIDNISSNPDLITEHHDLLTDLNNLKHLKNTVVQFQKFYCPSVESSSSQKVHQKKRSKNTINWIGTDEQLSTLIDLLKENGLIDGRQHTQDIIGQHFKHNDSDKINPIKWCGTLTLLAYLIESLDKQFIEPENLWADTTPHFEVNGKRPSNMRQTANNYKDNPHTNKPKGYQRVDKIISNL